MRVGSPAECDPLERVREGRFLIRAWPDGCVVFDRLSGDTHALDPLAARVFVSSMAIEIADRLEDIRQRFPALAENEYGEATMQARDRLADLGLLARPARRE